MAKMQCRLSLAGFAIILCATSAWGQTKILTGDIPFPFHIGDKHFAAGNYDVRIGEPYGGMVKVVSRTNVAGSASVYVGNDSRQNRTTLQSKLVFNKYGEQEYFLSQVWHPFRADSMKARRSEHELVTSRLITGLRPEKVVIWAAVRLP
jgi:hypothetical protein